MKAKTFSVTVILVLIVAVLNFSVLLAKNNSPDSADPLECKWLKETCPDNTFREVCVTDGGGNKCTCG